jgi:hypothetical protein
MATALNCKLYSHVPKLVVEQTINLATADIKVALFNNVHTFNTIHTAWSDIKVNEIVGTGYSSGGIAITHDGAVLDYDAATGIYTFGKNAMNTEWIESTLSAYFAVGYIFVDSLGVPDDASLLLFSKQFDGEVITSNATFRINWDNDGIFRFIVNPS